MLAHSDCDEQSPCTISQCTTNFAKGVCLTPGENIAISQLWDCDISSGSRLGRLLHAYILLRTYIVVGLYSTPRYTATQAATHDTLQHDTLQHKLQHTIHCNTIHCNTSCNTRYTATRYTATHAATHDTLQHTLQHTMHYNTHPECPTCLHTVSALRDGMLPKSNIPMFVEIFFFTFLLLILISYIPKVRENF